MENKRILYAADPVLQTHSQVVDLFVQRFDGRVVFDRADSPGIQRTGQSLRRFAVLVHTTGFLDVHFGGVHDARLISKNASENERGKKRLVCSAFQTENNNVFQMFPNVSKCSQTAARDSPIARMIEISTG